MIGRGNVYFAICLAAGSLSLLFAGGWSFAQDAPVGDVPPGVATDPFRHDAAAGVTETSTPDGVATDPFRSNAPSTMTDSEVPDGVATDPFRQNASPEIAVPDGVATDPFSHQQPEEIVPPGVATDPFKITPSEPPPEDNTATNEPMPQNPGSALNLGMPEYSNPILPELPSLPAIPLEHVHVKEFRFTGNTVFGDGTLGKVIKKYLNTDVTAEDLEDARQSLTLYYVNHGYINSGAIFPDQDLKGGIVRFKIVEGRLTSVNITGNKWFQAWWLRNEARLAAGKPLNFSDLKGGLQLLRENPTIAQVNAELQPAGAPGESRLNMEVKDTQPFRASLEYTNNRPPSVGSEIVNLHLTDLNLTGNNDILETTYGIAQSTHEGATFCKLEDLDGSYTCPVSPYHTTLQLRGSTSNSDLIEAPFNTLNINSQLLEFSGTLRQEIYEKPTQQLAASLTGDFRRSKTDLLGLPFSLSPGEVNGVEQLFALRCTQDFLDRSQVHVLSIRSTFSFGLDTLNATINRQTPPDGRFFDWLGQGQYIRRLGSTDNLVVLRMNAQVSDRPLLAIEQFEMGGSTSVRGYLENQALRDNGVFGSAEVRVPVLEDKGHNSLLSLAPFVDMAVGWNNNPNTPGTNGEAAPQFDSSAVGLPSAGLGILYTPNKYVDGQLYWGYALNRRQMPDGNSLQNSGIYFDLTVNAF